MTWAQGTFAYCFGIVVPAVGFLVEHRLRREGKPRTKCIKGAAFAAGATFLTLLCCCFIATLIFPHYPHQQVPELLANAFTLPGMAVGVAAIWYVSKPRIASKRFCMVISALAIALYFSGVVLCYHAFTWSVRKALPWSASSIQESYWSEFLLPDYSYQLKARITEDQFRSYITKFGLTPHTDSRQYSDSAETWLQWRADASFGDNWWDPSVSLTNTYVWQGGDTWVYAKYERGNLYLESLNH
jgi:hypothetical protein